MTELSRQARRIALAYAGTLIALLVLAPLAVRWTMAGHSGMYVTLVAVLVGGTGALITVDIRTTTPRSAVALRAIVGCAAMLAWLAFLVSLRGTPFLASRGWMLFPVGAPLLAAVASAAVLHTAPGRKER